MAHRLGDLQDRALPVGPPDAPAVADVEARVVERAGDDGPLELPLGQVPAEVRAVLLRDVVRVADPSDRRGTGYRLLLPLGGVGLALGRGRILARSSRLGPCLLHVGERVGGNLALGVELQ